MAVNYYYNYAEIDPDTNMCVGVQSTTVECTEDPTLVEIPVYDEEYIMKYYNWEDGKFYLEPTYETEWTSPLL